MIELNHNDFPKFLQDIDLSDPSAIFCYNIIKLCCQFRNLNGLENHFVKHLYVNQWPKVESIAIVTPAHESGFDLTLTIWAKRPGDLPKFIEILDEKLQLRKKSFRHWGPRDILKHLHDHFKQVNVGVVEISESPFDCVMMPKSSFTALREENIEPPPGLTFDEIRADEAELVDSFWKFRGPGSVDPTREKITSLPSVCLRDSSGLAVSFCLSHQLGVFNHGFTLADYRGKGLIVPVYKRLAQIHLQLGLHPCAFVEVGNVASLKVFVEKLHWDNMNMQFYDFLYRANLRDK